MAHELEQQSNGNWSFVAAREPGWHNLGKVYADRTGLTLDEILTDLNVGTLIEAPVTAVVPTGWIGQEELVTMPGKKMIIRQRKVKGLYEHTPLGVVGDDYKVIPEAEAFAFLDAVVDLGGANWQTAMLLKGGSRAAACMKLDEGVLIGGVDAVDLYALVSTSHDGSLSLTAAATPIRVVCQNTLTWGLAAAAQKWSIRHSKHADLNADEARRMLKLAYAYAAEWTAEAERLLDVEMTKLEFEKIVADLYAPKAEAKTEAARKAQATSWDAQRGLLLGLWDAPTQENVKGTAYAGLNALTEYHDWFRGARNPGDDPSAYRFERALTESASPEKNKIHGKILEFAGI
jgi:phage/plasmid-like protein (TIGR03299 family)